jgi:hypothetical protein
MSAKRASAVKEEILTKRGDGSQIMRPITRKLAKKAKGMRMKRTRTRTVLSLKAILIQRKLAPALHYPVPIYSIRNRRS